MQETSTRSPGSRGGDRVADLDDRANGLVTEDRTRLHLGDVALEDVEVRAADRGRVDSNHDVGRILDGRLGLLFPAAKPGAVVDERLHDSSFAAGGLTAVIVPLRPLASIGHSPEPD